ncbi:MAG: hypothetical protein M3R34_02275 [Acidobacteriota bacterium]|nr:hypothetical protein [Acidobacteriota bacterium]
MSSNSSRSLAIGIAAAVLAVAALRLSPRDGGALAASPAPAGIASGPSFDDAFWKRWGDGKGELAGYDLSFPRYGELRKGEAVTIFVAETFSNSLRVKADPGKHPKTDEYPVLKLNLVQDFSTGIYDYNMMTSTFVALSPVNGRPAGAATKVSFSAQEWCGNAFAQLLFDTSSARFVSHSYFDQEADQQAALDLSPDAFVADTVLLWARGFAAPALAPGERREVTVVGSLRDARLKHRPVEKGHGSLFRAAGRSRATVPAGTFDVERRAVELPNGLTWTIDVEAEEPHRIIQWQTSEGEKAALLASDRLDYWRMHSEADRPALAKLGLKPRPPRTP